MDRFAYGARCMEHGHVFRIAPAFHAECAADVLGEKAQFFRLDVHSAGNLPAYARNTLRADAQRKLIGRGVVTCRGRTCLKRSDHQTLIDELDSHNMCGLVEGTLKCGLLFAFRIGWRRPVEANIAGRLRPELRGVLLYRLAWIGDWR